MIPIKFTAVKEGVSKNNIRYTAKELLKSHHSMADKPILKDHDAKCDNVVGRTNMTAFSDMDKAVIGEGFIDDENMENKIKKGLIKEVSIGAIVDKLVKESEDSDIVEARGISFQELSLVPIPGVCGTSISQSESVKTNEYKVSNPLTRDDVAMYKFNKHYKDLSDKQKEIIDELVRAGNSGGGEESAKPNVEEKKINTQGITPKTEESNMDLKVKEEVPAPPAAPAPAPAQQDPVQMIMAKLEQIVQMLGPKEAPKQEAPKEAAKPEVEEAKPKGKVSTAESQSKVITQGAKQIFVDENGKKFCKEHTRYGVNMYYI